MLTPEYLNMIEFNDVVDIYTKLNINITADIIRRVSAMGNISSATKNQIKILVQTNGKEIFEKTLMETSMLTADRKKALKELFEDVAKNDIQVYKELYKYRNKPFKLSNTQYQILNAGLKQTDRILKNFTNTIAFRSKQTYVDIVDEAYTKVISGAFDYATAINQAVQRLADKGVTLKDSAGRNVQLEVAVRRNVMSGIEQTTGSMNESIEDDLGCDGYEVPAHFGARPTHAEAQGKQYAKNHNSKISKKYPLWSTVSDLWEEYGCRHKGATHGIILGISKPQYTEKELEEMKNAKVILNSESVPLYEATQKQRALENKIRHQKRTVQILEKSGQDVKKAKANLAQTQKELTAFCKETRLEKDYSRTRIAK